MSYDIELSTPKGRAIKLKEKHQMKGGTYCVGGESSPSLNITYNYADHFYRVFGEKGIRTIYGITGKKSIPILQAAADKLGNDTHNDYWEPTEGNAKRAILDLIELAKMCPRGVWRGD